MERPQIKSDPGPIADAHPAATVRTIDYETPRVPKQRLWPFWGAFVAAYLPGVIILGAVDEAIHRLLIGHPGDGGIMFLSLFFSPIIAVGAGSARQISPRCRTPGFAAAFAVLAPLLLYLACVSVYLLTR